MSDADRCLAYNAHDPSQVCSVCNAPEHRWWHHSDAINSVDPDRYRQLIRDDVLAMQRTLKMLKRDGRGPNIASYAPIPSLVSDRGAIVEPFPGMDVPPLLPPPPPDAVAPRHAELRMNQMPKDVRKGFFPGPLHPLWVPHDKRVPPTNERLCPWFHNCPSMKCSGYCQDHHYPP